MSEIKTNKITGVSTAGNITVTSENGASTMQLQQGLCKSWVNQQNDAANNTNDSFNVASDVDEGNGDNTFTVTNVFRSDEFVVVATNGHSALQDRYSQIRTQADGKQQSSSTYRVLNRDESGGSSNNVDGMQVICMGDLA